MIQIFLYPELNYYFILVVARLLVAPLHLDQLMRESGLEILANLMASMNFRKIVREFGEHGSLHHHVFRFQPMMPPHYH